MGVPGNLPVAVTNFVGRRQETAEVRRRLSAARLLTLTGVGGVGKTRLALEAAAGAGRAFADGVWLVDLAPVTDPALVARTAATALGVPDQSAKPADEQLTDHLAHRRALIVLDNCEHLVDACAVLADQLLRHAPDLRILATSRQTLGIAGEHVFTVPPLSAPPPGAGAATEALPGPAPSGPGAGGELGAGTGPGSGHRAGPGLSPQAQGGAGSLEGYDAVSLLVDRATAIQPEFRVTERNREAVARLCAQLDGIPLAIELAASRLRSLPIEDLVTRLADRFALLTGGSRAAQPRQRTLRALVDWSHELCTPAERLLWARLAVFSDGFTLDAAEGVCAGQPPAGFDDAGGARPSSRDPGVHGEATPTPGAGHGPWARGDTAHGGSPAPGTRNPAAPAPGCLEASHAGQGTPAAEAAEAGGPAGAAIGDRTSAAPGARAPAAPAPGPWPEAPGTSHHAGGGHALGRGQIVDLVDRLVAQSIVLVDGGAEGRPRYRMLETLRQYGRQRLAESGEEATLQLRHRDFYLALAERTAAAWCGPGQEDGLALLRAEHGNLRAALEWSTTDPVRAQAALALAAALRHHWCADGFLSEGRRWLDRALAMSDAPTPARLGALWVTAWAALLQGDHASGDRRLTECEALAAKLGDEVTRSYATSFRGTSALFRGRLPEAAERFRQAADEHTRTGNDSGLVLSLFQLAITHAHSGDREAAATGERAVAVSEQRGERWGRSYALWALGYDAWRRGQLEEAEALARSALEIQRGFNDYVGVALMMELHAWIAASQGEHRRAGRLLGVIRSLWRTIGTTISAFGPDHAENHARCERSVVQALRADGFQAALAESGRIDRPDQAIAYALDNQPDEPPTPSDTAGALTRREREVSQLVAQGMSNRRIAASLVLSPRTVDGHVERILAKLGFTSRAQIAAWTATHLGPAPDKS